MATTSGLNAVIDPSLEAQRESEVRGANQFTAGLERGARGLAATAIGAGEALTSALGLERTQAALKEVGDEQAALAQQAPVRVSRVEDIGSVEDAVDWAVAGLGQVAPSVVASLAGGAVGGAITRAVAGGASRFAVTAGQAAGAGTVGTTLGTGEAFREIQEETGVEAPGKSLATGAVLGALDVAGLGSGLRAARAVGRAAVGGTRQGVGRKLLAAPLVEGTTEAAQEATLIGARASEDEDFDLEQEAPELRSRLLNSFALGALAGGAFATPGAVSEGAGRLRERLAAQDPDVAAQFDRELAKARGTGAAMRGKSLLDEGDQETLGEVLSFMEQRGIDDIPVELPGQGEVSAEQFEAGRGEGTSISLSSMLLALRQEQGNFRALEPRLQQAYTQLWSKLSPEGQQQFLEATTAVGVLGQDEAAAAPVEAPQAEEDPLDTAARLTSANERLGQALDQVLDPEGTALSQGVGRELGIEELTPLGQTREQGREIVAQLAEGLSQGPIHESNRRKIRTLVQQGKVSAASPEVRQVLGDGTIRPKTTSDLGPDVLMLGEEGLAENEELDGDFGMLFDLTQDADSDALLTFEERTQQMQVIGEDDPQLLEVLPNMNISGAGRITIPKAPNKLEAGLLFSAPDEETGAHRPSSLREKVDTLNASDPAHVYSVSNLYDVERLQARRSGVADLEQHIVDRARTTQQLLGRPTEVEDPETGEITATEGDPLRGQPIEDLEQAQAFLRNFGRLVRAPVQGLGRVGMERFTLEQLTGKVMATELARLRLSEQQSLLEDEQRALSAAAEDPRTGEPISKEEQGARLRALTAQITQVKRNKTVIGQGQEGRAILRKPKRSPVKQDKLRQELRAGTLSGSSREFVKQVLFKGVKQETHLRTGLKAEDWRRLVNEAVKPTRGTVTMVVQDEPFDVNIQSMISEANRGLPQGLNTEADLRRAYAEAASALTGVLTDRFLASAAEAQRKGYTWNEAEQTYALDSTLDGFQALVAQAEEEGAIWVDGLQTFEPAEGDSETAAKKFNNQLASEIARLNRIRNAVSVGAIPPQTVAFTRRIGENAFAQREYSAEELETVGTFDTKVAERAQIDQQIGRAELVLQYDTRAARRAQAKEGIELLETRGKALDAEIESLARRPGEGVEGRIGLLRDEGRELGLLYQPNRERLEEIRHGLVAQLEQHGLTDPQRAAPIKRQLDRLDTDRFIPQSVDAIPLARTYNERLDALFAERVREDEAFDPREAERVAGQEEVSFEPVELDPIEAFPASGKEPEQAPSLAPAPIPEQAELRRGKGDQPTFGIEADLAQLLDKGAFEAFKREAYERVTGLTWLNNMSAAKARGHAFTLRALISRAYFDQTFADRNELGAELTAVENAREALRDGVAQVRHDAARAIDLKTPGKTEEERIKAAYKVVFGWSPNVRDVGDLNRLRTELKRAGEETGFQQPTPNSIWASIRRARLGGGRTSFRSDTNPFGLAYNEQQDAYVVDEKSLGFRAARQRANELGVVWEGAAKQFAASPDKSRDSNKILAQRKKAARQLNTSLKQELTRLNKQHRDLPRIRAELRERQEPRYLKRVEDAERTAMLKGRLLMNRIIQLSEEMPFSFWGDLTASSPGSFDLRTADWIETVKDPKDPEILAKIEQLREESAASKRAAAERKGAAGNVSPPTPQATARAGKTVWQSVVSASKSGTRKKAITQQINQALGTLGPNFTKPTSSVYVNWEYADATQITDLVPEIKAEIENGTLWGYVFTDNDTGKHHVFVHPMLKDRKRLQTDVVAHEVGHLIFRSAAQQATAQEKTAIYNDYLKWVEDARDKKDVPEILKRRGIDPETVDQMLSKDYRKLSEAERQYLFDFEEFFADKVTRAAQPGDPKLHLKGASEPARTLYQRVAERMKAIFKHFTAANTVREFIQRVGTDQLPVPYVVGEGTMNKASEQPSVAKAVAGAMNGVEEPAENIQGFGDFPQEKVEAAKALLAGLKIPNNVRLGFVLWEPGQQVINTEGMSPGQVDLAISAHFQWLQALEAGNDPQGSLTRDTANYPNDRLIVMRRDLLQRSDEQFTVTLLHELGHFITDSELSSADADTQIALREEYQTKVLERVQNEDGSLKNIGFQEALALTQPPDIVQNVLNTFKQRAYQNVGGVEFAQENGLDVDIEAIGTWDINDIFGEDSQNGLVPTSPAWLLTWISYPEYQAGQVAKWALTNERPKTIVERFYAEVAAAFQKLYVAATRVFGAAPNGSFENWLNSRWDSGATMNRTPDGSEHNLAEPASPAARAEGTKAEERAAAKHEKREQDKLKTAERIYRGTVQRKSDAAQKDAANRLRDLDPQEWYRAVLEAARAENTPDVFFRRLEEARKREEERRTEQEAYSLAKTQNRAEATGEAADAEAAALAGAGQAAAGGGDAALRGELLGREQEEAGPPAERGQTIEGTAEEVPPAGTPPGGQPPSEPPDGGHPFAEPGKGKDGERLRRILSQVLGQDARIRVDDFVELFLSKDPALAVLRPDEFSALGRAMMQPIVVRRLQEALRARGDERGLRLIDSQRNPILFVHYRMAHAYDLGFMEQAVQLGPQTSEIFGKVRGLFERVTGKQLFDSRANQVMQGLIANTIFRRAMGELDQFQLVTYKEATGKVNRTVQWVLRQLDALFDANGFGPILVGLSDRRLRATGNPFLIRIADLFHIPAGSEDQQNSFMAAKMKQTSHFLQILGDVYEGINPAEADEIGAILRKAKPLSEASNARVREAVTRTRELLRQMRTYTTNAGVALGDRGDDYFPMVFSVDKLLLERPAFIKLLNEEAFNAPMHILLKRAQRHEGELTKDKLIDQIYNQLVNNNGDDDTDITAIGGPPDDIFNPQFRFMNRRMLDFLLKDTPEALAHRETVNALLSHDHGTILSSYIHQGVKRAEFTRMFGSDGKVLRALMSQARKAGATDAQMRLVVNTIQAHQGNLGIGWNKNISKWTGQPSPRGEVINKTFNTAQSWLLVALNFAFLPMAVFSSLIDPIGIYARTGRMDVTLWGWKEGIANAMGNFGRNIDRAAARREGEDPDQVLVSRWDELAQAVGIADREVLLDALTSGYTSNQLPTKARKWNDAFFRWTGLEGWTRITRRMALASGTRMLEKIHTGQYVGFGDGMGREGRAKEAERRLRELNLDRELLARTWDEDTQTFQVLTSPERAELEQGTRTAEEQQRLDDDERLREGLRRFVDESVLHPNPAMRPVWMSNPWLAVPGYLKHYMFSFYDRIMRRMGYEITQDAARGSRTALVALTMYPAVMIAADAARHAIQGIDDDDRDDWTYADWMMYGTYRAGLLGPAGLAFEALQDREHGGVGYESALGPAAEFLLEDAPDLLSFYSEDASEAWLKVTPFSAVHRHWDLWDD